MKKTHGMLKQKCGMWFRTRISNFCFQCPTVVCYGVRFKLSTFISFSQGWPSITKDPDEFFSWLQRKAGVEVSSVLSIGNSVYDRSIFASKFIQAGDCILKIPFKVHITTDNILPEIKSILSDEVSSNTQLALVILAEQRLGQASEWAPYMCSLPHINEMHNTIFWGKEELEMVRQSSVYVETIHHKACIEKEFLKVKPAFECFPQFFEGVTFEKFMHAYALVGSRAWETISKGLSLIPFADFLNHDGSSEAVLLSDEDKHFSEVIADRDYAVGEQVLIRYGKFSNATLLLDFGFTLPYNIYDQVQILMDISQHDPLRSMKLEILDEHRMPVVADASGFNSRNSFTIKEVRSAKGRGIPHALRAFARILSASTPQELEDLATEAAKHDGRLARCPLKNRSKEIQAHHILLSRIVLLIQEYEASILSLQSEDSCATKSQFTLRRQMSRDLLAGELRVLQSASSWLKNYCTSLSAGTHP